jgi:tetratricopeptide (TPR) repeat protein
VKLFGYTNRDVARTANALGRLLCFLGKYERSRELLELAWKLQQDLKLEPMNLAVLRTLFNLAVLKREEGFYDEALEALERAAALQLKRGEGNNSYLVVQIELAILKNACGQPEDAVALLEQVQKLQRVKMSPEHPDRIRASLALAQSYIQIGHLDLAEKALTSIQEISPKFLTADHPYNLKLRVAKAEISRLRGEYGNSVVDDLSDTIGRLEQVLGTRHPETIYAGFVLGQVYLEQGLEQQGRERIRWSIDTLTDCLGQNHPKVKELLKREAASLARSRLMRTDKGKENVDDWQVSV